jgi:hypothetical protein
MIAPTPKGAAIIRALVVCTCVGAAVLVALGGGAWAWGVV